MGIFSNVKDKLGFQRKDDWDDYDDYDEDYDDFDDYSDDYDDDYDNSHQQSSRDRSRSSRQDDVADWPSDLSGGRRRESRVSTGTPLVSNADVRSKAYDDRRQQSRANMTPDYESSLQNYKIEQRDSSNSRQARTQESLQAAREELESLKRGIPVPTSGASSEPRQSDFTPSTVSRRIVTVIPTSYADAEQVSDAFRSGSSAVISFAAVSPELAKRLLDFSFGVVSVSGGSVQKIGDKVFFLNHGGVAITESEKQQLRDAGVL